MESKRLVVPKLTLGMRIKRFFSEYVIIYGILILFVAVALTTGIVLKDFTVFLSISNLMNVMRQISMTAIIAAGMYFVLVSGGIDISVGATVGLVNILFSGLMVWYGMHPVFAVSISFGVALVVGLVNGVLVAYFGIAPMIATLGTQSVMRGLIFVITNAYPVFNLPTTIYWIGNGYLLKYIPIPVVIMLFIFILANFISKRTKFGRSVYAIGGNIEAAYLSGIKEKQVRVICYMVVNIMAAVSAIILTSRLSSGQPNSGLTWEFEAIIAAVIGGVSITGGKGKAYYALLGAIMLGLFTNGMTLLNINSYFQQMIKGIILISAIGLDVYMLRKKAKV